MVNRKPTTSTRKTSTRRKRSTKPESMIEDEALEAVENSAPEEVVEEATETEAEESIGGATLDRILHVVTGLVDRVEAIDQKATKALEQSSASTSGKPAPEFDIQAGPYDSPVSNTWTDAPVTSVQSGDSPYEGNVLFFYDPNVADPNKRRTQATIFISVEEALPAGQKHIAGVNVTYASKGLFAGIQEIPEKDAKAILASQAPETIKLIEKGVVGLWHKSSDIRVLFDADPQLALKAIRGTRSVELLRKWAKHYNTLSPTLKEALEARQEELKASVNSVLKDVFGQVVVAR